MNPNDELDLNAFIDAELTPDQQAELLEAMRGDPELARQACELGQMKARMRLAYADPPPPPKDGAGGLKASGGALAAGVALLAAGLIGGWLLHAGSTAWDPQGRYIVLDPEGRGQAPATSEVEETRIVFHMTEADQTAAGDLLDEVEDLLVAYEDDHRPLRVEVVSNNDGLTLLRDRLSEHKARIHELSERFSNLTFVACRNTIRRLKVEHGIEVKLIPDAEVIDSGVSHVVKRQKEGWSYIRV